MNKYYVINETVEFYPVTSELIHTSDPEAVVALNAPSARCLMLLIERAGSVVTQQDFMDAVWINQGMQVSPNTYYQNICILRKGLKKVGFDYNIVVTLPRIGLTLASDTQIAVRDIPPARSATKAGEVGSAAPGGTLPPTGGSLTGEADSITAPLPGAKTRFRPARWRRCLALSIAALLLAAGGSMYNARAPGSQYFADYGPLANVEHCHFFISPAIQTQADRTTALGYGEKFKAECVKLPWIYISRNSMASRTSILRCDSPMSEPNRCISDYFIEKH